MSWVFGIVGVALLVLGMIVGAAGEHYGSYLCSASQSERVFRKPFVQRLGGVIIGFGVLLFPLVLANRDRGMMVFCFLLCIPAAVLLLRLSGPSELQIDLVERTYRRVRGWPISSSTYLGAWADMQGVYVRIARSTNGDSMYFVGVRGSRFGRMSLGCFEAQAAAEQFAEELMSDLSLPRALSS